MKKQLTHEQSYIKAICKAQRESIGFQPAIIQKNRKRYDRNYSKREVRHILVDNETKK